MNSTSIRNYGLCLRYIWQTHRRFYIRNIVSPSLVVLILAVLTTLPAITSGFLDFEGMRVVSWVFSNFLIPIWAMVIVCSTFHPLYTRGARTDFLMLPVGNAPKFWAMITMAVISIIQMALLTEIVGILIALPWGTELYQAFSHFSFSDFCWHPQLTTVVYSICIFFIFIPGVALWINSKKYRHNIVPTAIVLLLIFSVVLTFGDVVYDVAFLVSNADSVSDVVVGLVFAALGIFCWARAYANFCHAEIVNRLNH